MNRWLAENIINQKLELVPPYKALAIPSDGDY